MDDGWQFWIDVGGTFTDCLGRRPDGEVVSHKLLSTSVYKGRVGVGSSDACIVDAGQCGHPPGFFEGFDFTLVEGAGASPRAGGVRIVAYDRDQGRLTPARPLATAPRVGSSYELRCGHEAPVVGIRWLMGLRLGEPIGRVGVRLGTTRGTNALLEHKVAPTALVTTAGFGNLLEIGYQTRPRLFDLHIRKPIPLYRRVVEVGERIDAAGHVLRRLDVDRVRSDLEAAREAGIEAVAVCLMNSYRNPAHELEVERVAREVGFLHVSVSSRLSPLRRIIPRAETAVVDACLTPVLRAYLESIQSALPEASIQLLTSAGALVGVDDFAAKDSVLSGPAGGVVGYAQVAGAAGFDRAIGFDMGGTSTDVSRFDGAFERRHEMHVEDRATGGTVRIVGDMLAIETVAAGGGSLCGFDGVKPIVGPDSAGADPGPACYGRGGPLCLTDANVHLGRVPAERFPFPLDRAAARRRLDERIAEIESATGRRYTRDELAAGYLEIANAHMAAAIRRISVQRGYDVRAYTLVAFGGAGGQHACAIARRLGIRTVLLHPLAGVLSAYGAGVADVRRFAARDVARLLDEWVPGAMIKTFDDMEAGLRRDPSVTNRGRPEILRMLDLVYFGQDAAITVGEPADGNWGSAFERMHQTLYGFAYPGRPIQVCAARVESVVRSPTPSIRRSSAHSDVAGRRRDRSIRAYFAGGRCRAVVRDRADLLPGDRVEGPAIILELTSTIVIEPGWSGELREGGDLILRDGGAQGTEAWAGRVALEKRGSTARGAAAASSVPDPVTLELFNSQFAAIAEHMGATLERTASSTNVRERLDFSCAIYDAGGGLVANAPHIPVHLGAMGECIRCLIADVESETEGRPMRPGDVFVTNDPYRGGSHLPDVTVITPVFDEAGGSVLFFAASRAHHAEIGGVAPGSMPAESRSLADEGVVIRRLRLSPDAAAAGHADGGTIAGMDSLRRLLASGPHPSREVERNLADVQAQMAANRHGVEMLTAMTQQYGLETVHAYMGHIQRAAEAKMRSALGRLADGDYEFTDRLDDGTSISVRVTIDADEAIVDFAGTGGVHAGNLNATPAIVASCVLYCFRCLIEDDIPLNAGVLAPIRIIIPEACLLNPPSGDDPGRCPAVAGGNVETSQRIVDVVFGALGVVAAGQGTMNNVVFGNETFGYYETIGGGAGAGPDFDGADAVHVHMTNTRLTDPEVLEARYPVRLRRFAVRRGSGGDGRRRGGDGIVREIEFLEPLDVSIVTQRRVVPPYGLQGGGPGVTGRNRLVRAGDARSAGTTVVELPSACGFRADRGDILLIETPGGGGFGRAGVAP